MTATDYLSRGIGLVGGLLLPSLLIILLAPSICICATNDSTLLNPRKSSHWQRNLLLGNVICGSGAFFYFSETWGAPNGRFHLKDELHDNMHLNDEVSHFFVAYKVTHGFRWLFRLLKMPPEKVDLYASLQTAFAMTLVEFPMDAYNPSQGFGWTDLVADYAGIGFAELRRKHFSQFDIKFSVKRPPWKMEHKLLANNNDEFDNFIYWGTWKPRYLWLGLGYCTNHRLSHVESESYLGVGTTIYDLFYLVKPRLAGQFKFLDSYYVNLSFRL